MTQGYTPDGYVMTMTYDAVNRLTSAEFTDSSSVLHRTEYSYSGDSLLAEMKKYENGTMTGDTRFIRAGFLPVQERDGNNQVLREYTWGLNYGGGIGGLLNLNQSGTDYSYLFDGKGNVTALLDGLQSVVATYTYDAFGVLKTKTGTLDQPFQFSTKRYDESTGLSYYGYRFYSPSIGRWITRDPIGELGGINLYGFVANNPVNFIDTDGLLGIFVGLEIWARPTWARVPFPRVKPTRYIPPEAQRLGRPTPPRVCKPAPQPLPNPVPEPPWWARFLKNVADLLGDMGFGSAPPTVPIGYPDLEA